MIAFPKSLNRDNQGNEKLVSFTLKDLIDLSKPAYTISLRQFAINSQQSGNYLSRFKGRGMEFDEARYYQAGDDVRCIDWRVTARTGKTHTKVFREEKERPTFISVDYRAAMRFATRGVFKSVLAAKLASLLAWIAENNGDKIGGQVFSEHHCHEIKPQNGKHGVLQFLNILVKFHDSPNIEDSITLEKVLARLAQHARPGSVVYIISDFRGMTGGAESRLAKIAQNCNIVLLFIYDLLESRLPTKGRFRFTDMIRDITVDSSDARFLEKYHQSFIERKQRIESLSKKLGLDFVQCETTQDPMTLLKHRLGKM